MKKFISANIVDIHRIQKVILDQERLLLPQLKNMVSLILQRLYYRSSIMET